MAEPDKVEKQEPEKILSNIEVKTRLKDAYSEDLSTIPSEEMVYKKPKRTRCITRSMAEDFDREQVLRSSFIETIFYLVFVITCSIHVSELKNASMYYMNKALKKQFIEATFETVNEVEITFDEIKSVADVWEYSTGLLIEGFYFDPYYDKYSEVFEGRSILYENMLLGVPRIRQVRVRNDSCNIHAYFRRMFSTCYATFTTDSEDRSSFGLQKEPAWVYSSSSETLSLSYKGAVATYSGGGFYKDFEPTGNDTIEMLEELKENLWITRHTRAVFVDFTVYNVNINVFAVCKIIFELPPTGGVLPEAEFHCVRLISVVDQWDFVASICEYIFYVYILFYIMQSIREFVYFKFKYFLLFWSYIDCIISIISCMTFVLSVIRKQGIDESIELIEKNPNVYGNLEYMGYVQSMHNDLSAVLAFFVYVRLFKYLNFNKTMAQLNDTLKKCAYDILGFSIMFFIIFFAYAELGYLLFGYQVSDFRTFGVAMFSLLRTILGDFDYGEIEHAHRILAPIYFLSYIFFVFFVLLNMFLAIINDTYADVKTEIAIAPSELQMTDFIKRYFYKGLRKMGLKVKDQGSTQNEYSATAQEIRSALKKCGFEYLEIEMFFARYNIDPLANVNETDVNKLITLLEGGAIAAPKEAKVGYKQDDKLLLKNFVEQRRQLKQMEATVYKLAIKVEDLMLELDSLATGKVWAPSQHDEMPETESFVESEEEEEEDTGEIQL